MQSNTIFLLHARTDYSAAVDILAKISAKTYHPSIEDTMLAYMIAKDWRNKFSDCNEQNNGNNSKELFDIFDALTTQLEQELFENEYKVLPYFMEVNKNVVSLLSNKNATIKELTSLYIQSLICTANFFATVHNKPYYAKQLEEKSIHMDNAF